MGTTNTATKKVIKSVVINDCRYETTPAATIAIPLLIKITNFSTEGGAVTITFGPNSTENYDASVFVLQTSPTLGPSANWTTDTQAGIRQIAPATPTRPAVYQAQTSLDSGVKSLFYRIKKL